MCMCYYIPSGPCSLILRYTRLLRLLTFYGAIAAPNWISEVETTARQDTLQQAQDFKVRCICKTALTLTQNNERVRRGSPPCSGCASAPKDAPHSWHYLKSDNATKYYYFGHRSSSLVYWNTTFWKLHLFPPADAQKEQSPLFGPLEGAGLITDPGHIIWVFPTQGFRNWICFHQVHEWKFCIHNIYTQEITKTPCAGAVNDIQTRGKT
jgi:hypothetical protein